MMRFRLSYINAFTVIALLSCLQIKGEVIKGVVVDQDSLPVKHTIVQIMDGDKPLYYSTTRADGSYRIKADSITEGCFLQFSRYGYESLYLAISSDSIYDVMLLPKTTDLKEFVVRAPQTRVKGDTIEYDVAALTSKADRNIADIIRKLPGVHIQDDIIFYDGEPINRFYIEGLNMLGDDYSIATNNINPNDISSISIYERHQPKKVLTDLKMSDKAALNLKLKKKSLLRPIGYLQGGIGLNAEKDIRYQGNLYSMLVSPTNQTMISSDINNHGAFRLPYGRDKEFYATTASSLMEKQPLGNADIPGNRYYNNSTLDTEGSSLFKFNDDLVFSIRAIYGNESDSYSNASSLRYLASGQEDIIYQNKGHTSLGGSHLRTEAKIERNSSNNYLIDIIRFEGIKSDNSYDVTSEYRGVERLNNKELSLTNSFNTIIRKGGNLLEINSDISYADMPNYYMHYADDSAPGQNISQILSGRRFSGHAKGGYGYAFSNLVVGGELLILIENELFKSADDDARQITNNERGHILNVALRPYLEWKLSKMRWRSELETSYYDVRYGSVDNNRIFRHHKPYLQGSTSLYWRASAFVHMNAAFGVRRTFGGIKDFIESPIYSSFRTRIIPGNGNLANALSLKYSLNVSYSNPLQGLVCRGMIIYTDTHKNSLAASSIDSDGNMLTSNANKANKGKSVVWNLDISKRLSEFDIVFKLLANGMSTRNKRIRQDTPLHVITNLVNVDAIGVANLFSDRLTLDINCGYSYSNQSIKTPGSRSHISNFKGNCKLSWFILPYLELYGGINARQSHMENGSYRNFMFVDGGCRFKKSKYEIELAGKNLANVSSYEYCTMLPLEIDYYSYKLRPLEFMLTFKWIL